MGTGGPVRPAKPSDEGPVSDGSAGTREVPRILLAGGGTGGHLYPALNLAEALRRAEPRARLLLVGARRGVEARVFPGSGFPYRLLPMHPLHRRRPWRNWRLPLSTPAVVAGLAGIFRSFDPHLVVGTGGYAAGPAVLWGKLTGRRTAIQEQNAEPGLVSRLLARWVDQVHLGFPEARERLRPGPRSRVFAYGNPVALPAPEGSGERGFDWPPGRVVLVAGGSQGARGLNLRLLADLEGADAERSQWPADARLVWIAGPTHAEEVADRVGRIRWAEPVRVVPYIEGLGARLSRVSLAVSRAGAMFVSELAAAGVPAVLVPFPGAAGGHQTANAEAMAEAGAALVRREGELAPGELLRLVLEILGDGARLGRMARAARSRGAPEAAARIAAELLALAGRG